ncbi:ubiquinol oxidase subunit II [Sphingomonas chungangi]
MIRNHPRRIPRSARITAVLAMPLMLAGCDMEVLYPAGDVARQQAHLLAISTLLMLLIIIPVMALTILFAWRYRENNTAATYRPNWDHSTVLELVIWSAPLLIIIALGALTWITTHTLDPYRRLERISPGKSVPTNSRPLEIDVVALDWKWLFIYPEQGIATVNGLALPVDREVQFKLTASSVMNSFYVPMLAGQVYAMPGMQTQLHAVLNKTGRFGGISANYSGAGFSGMHFEVAGMSEADFGSWVAKTKAAGGTLDTRTYLNLAKPSEDAPMMRWASVDPTLFDRVVNRCETPGTPCMIDLMKKDMGGMPMGHPEGHQLPVNDTLPTSPPGALMRSPSQLGNSARPANPADNAPAVPHSHS